MERVMCESPGKNTFLHESINCAKSPTTFSTPVRQNEKRRQNGLTGGIAGFNLLPAHITPPSGLTKFIARNPFDADLTSRLHLSVISPTVFTKKVSSSLSNDSPGFAWSVDELALIQPAKIEEFPLQQMHSTDPDIEVVAQAAINEFFTATQIIPSPWEKDKKNTDEKLEMHTPSRPLEDLNLTREAHKTKKDCWSQTVLTLPPDLPAHVEETLKPFFTFNQDQNVDNEDANSSNNSSLRRKLFFSHDDCTEDEDESSFCLSPARSHASLIQSSPPQSGMMGHGAPLKGRSLALVQRTHGTPCTGNVSPPNMSPIGSRNVSPVRSRSRCQFAAQLDFTTDMSIDHSAQDDKDLKSLEDVEPDTTNSNTSMIRSNIIYPEVREARFPSSEGEADQNETAEMPSRETTPLKPEKTPRSMMTTSIGRDILHGMKIADGWNKSSANNDYCTQQNSTLLGYSCTGHQSDANSAQDTGYQTYSMSNVTNDNSNITNAKSFHWNERIMSNGDEIILSDWKDNMKNVFSSTPSKYTRRRDN